MKGRKKVRRSYGKNLSLRTEWGRRLICGKFTDSRNVPKSRYLYQGTGWENKKNKIKSELCLGEIPEVKGTS